MVADPTAHDGFVQIVVKPHLGSLVLTELSAFQVHDPFQVLLLLGPYYRCRHDSSNNQNKNETQLLHMFLPDHLYTNFKGTLRLIGFAQTCLNILQQFVILNAAMTQSVMSHSVSQL